MFCHTTVKYSDDSFVSEYIIRVKCTGSSSDSIDEHGDVYLKSIYLSDGGMKTGWQLVSGTWYYLDSQGVMAYNTTIGGYKLGASGAWIR